MCSRMLKLNALTLSEGIIVKIDFNIIRKILLSLEESPTPNTAINAKNITDFPEQEVAYNMQQLKDRGCINATILESRTGSGTINSAIAHRLTHSGHELLGLIRNDSVWEEVKDTCQKLELEMTFNIVTTVAKRCIESRLP